MRLHQREEIIYDIESTRTEDVGHRGSAGLTRLTFPLASRAGREEGGGRGASKSRSSSVLDVYLRLVGSAIGSVRSRSSLPLIHLLSEGDVSRTIREDVLMEFCAK